MSERYTLAELEMIAPWIPIGAVAVADLPKFCDVDWTLFGLEGCYEPPDVLGFYYAVCHGCLSMCRREGRLYLGDVVPDDVYAERFAQYRQALADIYAAGGGFERSAKYDGMLDRLATREAERLIRSAGGDPASEAA